MTNKNSNGSIDVIPGGHFNTQGLLKKSITESLANNNDISWYEIRTYKPNHTFIPTVSSLAFKNSNFDWNNSFDRNLVCTNEIPFDSYYGPKQNEKHTSFTYKSVDWVIKEMEGVTQDPTVYLNSQDLIGDDVFCNNQIRTYSFDNCKIPGNPVWSVSRKFQILSSTNRSITVKSISNGAAFIRANFSNGSYVKKSIYIGSQPMSDDEFDEYIMIDEGPNEILVENIHQDGSRLKWYVSGQLVRDNGNSWMRIYLSNYSCINNQRKISIRKVAECGLTAPIYRMYPCSGEDDEEYYKSINSSTMMLYPNPALNTVTISLNQNSSEKNNNIISAIIVNNMGVVVKKLSFLKNSGVSTINLQSLPTGLYVVRVVTENTIISKHLFVK